MTRDACRVCGNQSGNRVHHAREMYMGRRDPFAYVECAACGTLQIREVPDLRPYYEGDYYSFRPPDEPAAGPAPRKGSSAPAARSSGGAWLPTTAPAAAPSASSAVR